MFMATRDCTEHEHDTPSMLKYSPVDSTGKSLTTAVGELVAV